MVALNTSCYKEMRSIAEYEYSGIIIDFSRYVMQHTLETFGYMNLILQFIHAIHKQIIS